MTVSRRRFLTNAAAVTAGFAGLRHFSGFAGTAAYAQANEAIGLGALVADPQGMIDLPAGFSYSVFSRKGAEMDDGFLVPGKHDGMATFPGPDGLTILVRNHEITGSADNLGPFGRDHALFQTLDDSKVYDRGGPDRNAPMVGGTTTLVFDTNRQQLIQHSLSLTGTQHNCAGGPTPWGTWISCEENTDRQDAQHARDHGYNFEVPATTEMGLVQPVPLTAMGRFNHEAIAVNPNTGIVYQTEDRQDGAIYRFIPNEPGNLVAGGRLQVLALRDTQPADLRNWDASTEELQAGGSGGVAFERTISARRVAAVGESMPVQWMDIDNVESPEDDLRYRAFAMGAARFARSEGMWYGNDAVYFACTTGGPAGKGHIWRYTPSEHEGTEAEEQAPGTLELFCEPNDVEILKHADNICFAPSGDLIVCEDAGSHNHILGITPAGEVYKIAHNTLNNSEFAGSCFSPDGTTLFVNIQNPGLTLAITGPWGS